MRADRLISVLLLLQRHQRITVAQVARELEISERTARRDLESLMYAGVPVYSTAGRGGGWSLVGGASTDLSGLNEREAKALFLAVDASSDPETVQALRKLGQALPEPFRQAAEALASRSMVDHRAWGGSSTDDGPRLERPACFPVVADALAANREIEFTYLRPRSGASRRIAKPLGIVHKAGRWYVLTDTPDGRRNFRLDQITDLVVTDRRFEPPEGFDLEAAWAESMQGFAASEVNVVARGRVLEPGAWGSLRYAFKGRFAGNPPGEGNSFTVTGRSVDMLVRELIGFGPSVEVDDPPEVRAGLAAHAAAVSSLYATSPP